MGEFKQMLTNYTNSQHLDATFKRMIHILYAKYGRFVATSPFSVRLLRLRQDFRQANSVCVILLCEIRSRRSF